MKTTLNKSTDNKMDIIFANPDGNIAKVGLTDEELRELMNQLLSHFGELTLNQYQEGAKSTLTGNSYSLIYLLAGLQEEVGELSGKIAKAVRKGELPPLVTREDVMALDEEKRKALMLENSDCAWFISVIADWLGWTFNDVCKANLTKLADRKERGKIIGEGDAR